MVLLDDDMNLVSQSLNSRHLARATGDGSRPPCGSKSDPIHYNEGLHVAALFLILILSTLACAFPIIARRFPKLPIPHRFIFLSRHFGTGVLLATAFVHLLPTAFVSLTDPCLPPFWNEGYPAMAGFISMMSVLIVVGVEMFFATRGAGHVHGGDYGIVEQEPNSATTEPLRESRGLGNFRDRSLQGSMRGSDTEGRPQLFAPAADAQDEHEFGIAPAVSDEENNTDDSDAAQNHAGPARNRRVMAQKKTGLNSSEDVSEPSSPGQTRTKLPNSQHDPERAGTNLPGLQSEEQKLLLQCLLLEAGILFHSVFIGMALSVAVGTPFIVLLVAISFHQTFEGFALGSRIAGITAFGPNSIKPWLMALAYGITTPIGQAIGLGVHNLYDPESEMGLIMVGIFNSMSSGLLLFAGLVELLAPDFLSDESYQSLQGRKRLEACSAVVAGALLMALVGAWA